MTDLFLKAVDMALPAGWITLAVLAVRLLMKRGPKWVNPVLWGMVAVRLVFPFSVESVFSLLPGKSFAVWEGAAQDGAPVPGGTPAGGVTMILSPAVGGTPTLSPAVGKGGQVIADVQASSGMDWLTVAAVIWLAGAAVLLCYAGFSYLCLARRMKTAVRMEENVWQSEFAESPFVMGIFRPRIYLPFSVRENDLPSVIAHERAHIRRGDHWLKPLAFLDGLAYAAVPLEKRKRWRFMNFFAAKSPALRFSYVPAMSGHEKATVQIMNPSGKPVSDVVYNLKDGGSFKVDVPAGGMVVREL